MNQELRQAAVLQQAREALKDAWAGFVNLAPESGPMARQMRDHAAKLDAALSALSAVLETDDECDECDGTGSDRDFPDCTCPLCCGTGKKAVARDSSHLAAPTLEARSGSGVPARPTSPGEFVPELGDNVRHIPSGEEWLVAYMEDGRLAACGWPDELVPASDCVLVSRLPLPKKLDLLRTLSQSTGHRAAHAKRLLEWAALAASPLPQEGRTDAIRQLLMKHATLIEEGNDYANFELAYTRQTGWMAWLTDRPASGEAGTAAYAASRKVIARGQGDTPDEACADALAAIAGTQGEQKP